MQDGFSYELDTTKLTNGIHKIKLDFNGIKKDIELTVNNNPSLINVEIPTNEIVKGITEIKGYILSDLSPSIFNFMNCNIYVDGNLQDDTLFKFKTAIQRDDLIKMYPSYEYAGVGGFSYELDTTKLTNGNHKIKLNFNGIEKDIEIKVYNNPSLVNIEFPTMDWLQLTGQIF